VIPPAFAPLLGLAPIATLFRWPAADPLPFQGRQWSL